MGARSAGGGVLVAAVALLAAGCAGAQPGAARPGPVRIELVQAPAPDGRTLQVMVDRCHHGPYAVAVVETATRVTLRVSGGTPPAGTADAACGDLVSVHLARALGARGVFDLSSGKPVAVRTIRPPTSSSQQPGEG